jgi:uncharacterized protein (TIRG00374 family)
LHTPSKKTLIVVSLIVLGVMVLALATFLLSDISKLVDVFHHLEMIQMIFALLATGTAYLAFTLSFRALFQMTPYRIAFPKFFSIMFISATVNFIISSGGMSSIAIRAFLLKHEKVPYSVTIPLSFAQNMIFNLVLSCVCFGGLIYLHQHPAFVGGPKELMIFFFMGSLFLVVGLMVLIFFNSGFRRWFLRLIINIGNWINRKILRKQTKNKHLVELRNKLETSIAFLHKGWIHLFVVLFWVSMDWCFTALTLFFCFRAGGVDLPLGLLMVGFTVMFLSSNINPVPAGLGVSESLLALTFKLLGVSFEKTLVAAILFRSVFFILPIAISTVLYLDTMRSFLKTHAVEEKKHAKPKSR